MSTTPYAILGLLSIEPMSGYDIRQNLRESLSHFWSESYGQIYPALKRLAAEGLIAPARAAASGARDRRLYTLTRRGRARLRRWLAEPPRPQPPRNELLLKLFFGRLAPPGACAEHVRGLRERQEHLLALLEEIGRRLQVERRGHPDLRFWQLALDAGIAHCHSLIGWCDRTLGALDAPRRRRTAGSTRRRAR